MEQFTYEGKNQRRIETFMLFIYSVYNLGMVILADSQGWGEWVSIVMLIGNVTGWLFCIGKIGTYKFRAGFSALMMQISVVLYSVHLSDVSDALPIILAFVVFLGVYGIPKIIYITVISASIIFLWHGVVLKTIPFTTMAEIMEVLSRLGNIFLLDYVIYVWTQRNHDGSRQLLGVIEELKEVENLKDDFLANVSHEIRTPINTICGMSEIVLQEELPYKIKENVQDIQIAGRNLMSIVSDIIDFSELQSGNMELEEEAYNIASTINDVINMTLAKKNEKKIELIVDCDANIPCALLGDEKKLRRIIMNLVDNAIKFTDVGCVSITIGYRKESYGINLIVTVKDTGIGMDEESLEKLFTSFSQVDTGRNRHEGGLGLGLAISHALVQKMGGAITMKSKPGKGSTVQFVVPQKVLDEAPVASISNGESINVATYIDMEQFDMMEIRDEYLKNIIHMVEQLKRKCYICRNFAELQRRANVENFTHVFTSIVEYREQTEYFDELAKKTNLVVVLDRYDEKYVNNPDILKVYKPYYILTIVSVLNGLYDTPEDGVVMTGKFVTKDAHVLVVDDNRMNLRVIEGLLSDYKIKVTMASGGQEALEKITTADYDFIFMDHMMPEMDGVETLKRIRHKVGTYYQKVPIVALTANAVAGTREMLMAEGFSDFLEKPVERSVLERVLKRNLSSDKIIYRDINKNQSEKNTDSEVVATKSTDDNLRAIPTIGALEATLEREGLDVNKGILYCNGLERYVDVLRGYCEDYEDSGMLANKLFEKQDWKNYTIAVHGMKSAMRSIGAIKVSEIARELEMAGKEGRISFIMENHNQLMEEYQSLFDKLRQNKLIIPSPKKSVEPVEHKEIRLEVLEDEAFGRIIADMEEAMYALDGKKLEKLVTMLQQYEYHNTALDKELVQVKRKVEMSDYVSAVELVMKIKDKLSDKE